MDGHLFELAAAISPESVSVDALVDRGLARPSELLAWLDDARRRNELAAVPGMPRGHFKLQDEARTRVLAAATAADFSALAKQPALIADLLETARRGARTRGGRVAANIYRAVFETLPPDAFPGGAEAYVAAIVESIRLYRGAYGILGASLDRAVDAAVARGDIGSQALLIGVRALSSLRGPGATEAMAQLAQAREAAEAVGGVTRVELLTYTAVSLVFAGRLRQGIGIFEELLGDVPEDLLAPDNRTLFDRDSATPGAALCILAMAYSSTGQQPRAVELLHRLVATGERGNLPAVTFEARNMLALLHASRGELEEASAHAAAAFEHYGSAEAEPLYAYFAGISLAWVRLREGRLEEAERAFAAGLLGWKQAGAPPISGVLTYEIADKLQASGVALPEGFDPVAEAEKSMAVPLPHVSGMGQWIVARKKVRQASTPEELAAAIAGFDQSLDLLLEAGAVAELAHVVEDAASQVDRRGLKSEAARLRARAHGAKSSPGLPGAPPWGTGSARLWPVVLGLGRLPLAGRQEGVWGEISARLCEGLASERCALVALDPEARLLAARGGGKEWQEEVVERARRGWPERPEISADASGRQVVLVPFTATDLGRRGLVVLESAHSKPAVSRDDVELLEALGIQLGVLLGNVTLWQELARTRERLEQENRYFRESGPAAASSTRMVAHSRAMREVMGLVARAAPSNVAVLLLGDTGVGKELVAHEVHQQSPRKNGPFIAVHIASLAPGLVASGLFGHERGAFTGATEQSKGRFELADGGTLFLDEIGELSLEDQVRLLRVLQEGAFERVGGTKRLRSDFRVVAATNRNLEAEVRAGRFREDLYFRLTTFPIRVPPLRERPEEIPTLALYFMERVGRQRGVRFEGIVEADIERLKAWDWPGNVRELEHVIERAALLSEPPRLRIPPLEGGLAKSATSAAAAPPGEWVTLAESERRYIRAVLQHTRGRVTGAGGAAELLGLKPSTLNFRIRKLGLGEDMRRARHAPRVAAGG